MNDILEDLRFHREQLNHVKTENGFACECDASVGMVPCILCFEKETIDRAIKEIEKLRGSTDAYLGGIQSENTRLRAEIEKLKLDLSYSRSREDTREFIED